MMPERVPARRAAEIVGVSLRTIQDMAASGAVPGAAKIRGRWSFNEARLRLWLREKEAETCPTTSISGTASGGAGSRLPARDIDAAYERALS